MPAGALAARCTAQRLSGPPATSAEDAVARVLAVQGQDPRGFRLAVRARTAGITAADVDAALTRRRSLVVSWLNRGTLHLVTAADFWWLHDLTTPQLATESLRRLRQEGLDEALTERGIATVLEQVADGPRTREELRVALVAAGVPTQGQALVHLLLATTLRHRLIRGPVRDGEHCMVPAEQWLGPAPDPIDRDAALELLARRYLLGHGPATERDLAMWAKLPLRDARAAFATIAGETTDAGDGLLDLADRADPAPLPTRLLGSFDPILHGWVSRDAVLGAHGSTVVVAGGVFRSAALVDGRAAGLWRISGGRVRITPFAPLSEHDAEVLLEDADAVLRFLGLPPKGPVLEPVG
jgi:hypothetical protein